MPRKKSASRGSVTPMFPGNPPAEPPRWRGSFRPGGSYHEDAPGTDALTRGVLELLSARRMSSRSPAEFVELILKVPAAQPAFHEESMAQWGALTRFEDWWQARAQGSAEMFVKYEGCAVEGTWAGGHHVPRSKVNWEPEMPDHVRAAMNHELLEAIDRLAGHLPPAIGDRYEVGTDPAYQESPEEFEPALDMEG